MSYTSIKLYTGIISIQFDRRVRYTSLYITAKRKCGGGAWASYILCVGLFLGQNMVTTGST